MKIRYNTFGDEYEVTDGTYGHVTLTNTRSGLVFENFYTRDNLNSRIATGEVEVTEADPAITTNSLAISVSVDSSDLTKALALAKELEATILRIRGMFE